ncbi:MAG: helix-turn-helix domain-containing protein [Bacteroidales bacterium]
MRKILFDGISIDDFIDMIREVVRVEIQSSGQGLSTKAKDQLLSREQVCAILQISLPTFHRWSREGKLKVHKAGGRVLVKREDVQSCLKEVKVQKAHAPP